MLDYVCVYFIFLNYTTLVEMDEILQNIIWT
jgi:hypothetical protein